MDKSFASLVPAKDARLAKERTIYSIDGLATKLASLFISQTNTAMKNDNFTFEIAHPRDDELQTIRINGFLEIHLERETYDRWDTLRHMLKLWLKKPNMYELGMDYPEELEFEDWSVGL